ncbi:helix-turn-helix domain-containing protein, partial [Burkholderia contaminans]
MGVAQFADEDGYCWPGQRMLAEYTEQGERTVRDHLVWLEANGYLTRCARKRPDGTNASDAYYLNLSKPAAEFKTKRKKQPADFAASEKPKINRQISPTADFADGEKLQNQPANSAGHESVIVKPKGLTEPVRTARGSRLPDDWSLKQEWLDWTTTETAKLADNLDEWKGGAWSVQHTLFEADKFRDYWHAKSGKDATRTDWPATWRNWVR